MLKRLFSDDDDLVLSIIEYDNESDNYFIFGYFRNLTNTNVASKFFVTKLVNDKLEEIKYFDEKTHFCLQTAKTIEAAGFTD